MAVSLAAIEGNGWVLAVRGTWAQTPGAWENSGDDRVNGRFTSSGTDQFPLTPDATPKIVLAVQSAGFDRVAGQAVANAGRGRTLCATKALRRAYPNQAQLDEIDHGDGTRTVRFALSDRIYAGDVVSASFLAGWKAGQGAETIGSVTNGSSRALPVPISRWAVPSFTLVRGTTLVDVDVIVAAAHPEHFGAVRNQAIAAMKLDATDGTTTRSFWITGLRTSPLYGDSLRCWGAQIDLSGLTRGPVTIHRTLYPWIGASRSTGSGHSTDATNGTPVAHDSPLVLCYDPASDLYAEAHVFVDPVNGTTTAAAGMVQATLSLARAVAAASKPRDISTATQALYLANRTLPARNGWVADTARAMDWATITLPAGVSVWGASPVTSGANCNEGRLIIQGDPADGDPRTNCVWRSGSVAPTKQVARFWLQNLRLEAGEATYGGGLVHLDNVEVIGKPGFEAAATGVFSGTSPTGYGIYSATRLLWWKYGAGLQGSNMRAVLLRNCETSRVAEAVVHISSFKVADPLFTARTDTAFGFWNLSTAKISDTMLYQCRAMDYAGRFTASAVAAGAGTQADPEIVRRMAIVNCLVERSKGNSGDRIWGIGETAYQQMEDCIFEGLTAHGNGWNAAYNDSPSPFANLKHSGNLVRNCALGRHATKHDVFKLDGTLTGSWEYLFGVGFAGNVHGNMTSSTASNFQFAWFGLNAAVDTSYAGYGGNGFLKFVDDNSDHGPDAPTGTGNGDYRPDSGSPMRARAQVACIDVDVTGATRGAAFASGAMEGVPVVPVAVAPASATHGQAAGAAILSWMAAIGGADSRHLLESDGSLEAFGPATLRAVQQGRVLTVGPEDRTVWTQAD